MKTCSMYSDQFLQDKEKYLCPPAHTSGTHPVLLYGIHPLVFVFLGACTQVPHTVVKAHVEPALVNLVRLWTTNNAGQKQYHLLNINEFLMYSQSRNI